MARADVVIAWSMELQCSHLHREHKTRFGRDPISVITGILSVELIPLSVKISLRHLGTSNFSLFRNCYRKKYPCGMI